MHIFEASYSTLVTSVSKKPSVNQSELDKQMVSDCKRNYMLLPNSWLNISIVWSGFNLQVNTPPWLKKIFRFKLFWLLEKNFFMKLPPLPYSLLGMDLTLVPPYRITPHPIQICLKKFALYGKFFFWKKSRSYFNVGNSDLTS